MIWRRLSRERGFALAAILSLALGIGAVTAMFSLVDGVLLRPLAYPQSQQLVALQERIPQLARKYPALPVNTGSFHAWQQQSTLLSGIALAQPHNWVLSGSGRPLQVYGALVSASMFSTLGVAPRLGRSFTTAEDQPGQNHEIILTDAFWRSAFHANPRALGQKVDLDGVPNVIVGVMPAGFHFPHGAALGPILGKLDGGHPPQLFQPAGLDFTNAPADAQFDYFVVARRKASATVSAVAAQLDTITTRLLRAAHASAGFKVQAIVTPLRDQIVGTHARDLWLLLAAVAAILLIVCLNLANLLLVRIEARRHELAMQVALGASPQRIAGAVVAEGIVLTALGGALGVLAAWLGLRALVAAAPAGIPRLSEVALNPAVFVFALALVLFCGVAFSLGPAFAAARTHPQRDLASGGRGTGGSSRSQSVRACLVGAQTALAALLLILAGLLTASYAALLHVPAGFQRQQGIEANIYWPAPPHAREQFYRQLLSRLSALPGVTAAGLIDNLPTQGTNILDLLSRPGDIRPEVDRPVAIYSRVSPGYFAALGVPLLQGRTFTPAEMAAALAPPPKTGAAAPMPALISAATAAAIWPGQNPIGEQFQQSSAERRVVVGVVGDVHTTALDRTPGLQVYLPYGWDVPPAVAVAVRTRVPLPVMAARLRQAVWSVQPAAAVARIESSRAIIAEALAPRRFQMALVLAFALCALALAALGMYAVIAYSVARRTAEISIRMTLGARTGHLVGMMMRQGLTPVLLGLLAGVLAAIASGKLLASLLFGVRATNPGVILGVAAILLAVATLACALPARRATRVQPARTLRS